MPAGNRLAIDEPQFGVGFAGRFGVEIIAQSRSVETGDGITLGNLEQQFAQRRLADVQFELRVNHQFVFAVVIVQQLGNRQLRQNLIRANPQGKIGAGKAIDEPLVARRAENRPRRVGFRELIGRNLRGATGLRDLQPHRPFVDNAKITGKARGVFRAQLQHFRRLRKNAQRRLRLHQDDELVLLRLIQLDYQPAVGRVGDRLGRIPRQHLVALHARHLSLAVQQQRDFVQFSLHHFEIEQRRLPHQAGQHVDLRPHLGGEEKFAFRFRRGFLPRKFHRAAGRQVADEVAALAFGPRAAGELELRLRGQTLQHHRLQHAGRDLKIHPVPVVLLPHRRAEPHSHGEHAAAVKFEVEMTVVGPYFLVAVGVNIRERDRAGEQIERAALHLLDMRRGREGEVRQPAAQIAGELEIRQRDRRNRRGWCNRRSRL